MKVRFLIATDPADRSSVVGWDKSGGGVADHYPDDDALMRALGDVPVGRGFGLWVLEGAVAWSDDRYVSIRPPSARDLTESEWDAYRRASGPWGGR